jgi:hypothetical protein
MVCPKSPIRSLDALGFGFLWFRLLIRFLWSLAIRGVSSVELQSVGTYSYLLFTPLVCPFEISRLQGRFFLS